MLQTFVEYFIIFFYLSSEIFGGSVYLIVSLLGKRVSLSLVSVNMIPLNVFQVQFLLRTFEWKFSSDKCWFGVCND